jgi:hypothetical protein
MDFSSDGLHVDESPYVNFQSTLYLSKILVVSLSEKLLSRSPSKKFHTIQVLPQERLTHPVQDVHSRRLNVHSRGTPLDSL